MRKLIRQLMVLLVLGYVAYTFWSTNYGTPEKELEHIIMDYAVKGDVTGVEISLDQERVMHSNNNTIRDAIFRIVRGGVLDISFSGTVYNEKKNLARVDCSITRQGDNGPVTNRNYFYMCYDTGFGWSIYDILGYSNAHQDDVTKKDESNDQSNEQSNEQSSEQSNGQSNEQSNDESNEAPANGTDDLIPYFDRAATYADCTEQEILDAVAAHYYNQYGVPDVRARLDSVDGDIWLVQVYEDMGDHENSFDWYTIDRVVCCGTSMFGQDYVDLSYYLNREPIWIYVDGSSTDHIRYGHRTDGTAIDYGQGDPDDTP